MVARIEITTDSDSFPEIAHQLLTAVNTAIQQRHPLDIEIKTGGRGTASAKVTF
ncbi:MAG: hypothetical protein JWM41_2877 [Gemmatimonadetes bacterium]|nr:hypothetical protein [Gemmatimonadota bacterium]